MKVSKTSSVNNAVPGDEFNFVLTAQNIGTADATNVVITDTIAASLTIVSATGCTIAGQTVTCNVGNLTPGQSKSVTIRVRTTPASCPSVNNQGTVTAGNQPARTTATTPATR